MLKVYKKQGALFKALDNLAIAILFQFVIMMAETQFTPSNSVALNLTMSPKIINKQDGDKDGDQGFKSYTRVNTENIKGASHVLELSLPATLSLSELSLISNNLNKNENAVNLSDKDLSLNIEKKRLGWVIGLMPFVISQGLKKPDSYPSLASASEVPQGSSELFNFFYPSYSSEFQAFSDIQSQGFMIYLAFPFITILQGVLLWCVQIGVQRISGN